MGNAVEFNCATCKIKVIDTRRIVANDLCTSCESKLPKINHTVKDEPIGRLAAIDIDKDGQLTFCYEKNGMVEVHQ